MEIGRYDVTRGDRALTLRVRGPDGLRITATVLLGGALAVGALGSFVPPMAAATVIMFLGILGVVISASWGDRLASAGILPRIKRSLEVRPREGAGYREGGGTDLVIDGKSFDAARARTLTVRTIDNGKGRPIMTLYLALDDRAFVVETSLQHEPIRALAKELGELLEVHTPDDDGQPEPGRPMTVFIIAMLMLTQLGALVPAMVPALGQDRMPFLAAWTSALEIVVVMIVFAFLYRLTCRWLVKKRAADMFGF